MGRGGPGILRRRAGWACGVQTSGPEGIPQPLDLCPGTRWPVGQDRSFPGSAPVCLGKGSQPGRQVNRV